MRSRNSNNFYRLFCQYSVSYHLGKKEKVFFFQFFINMTSYIITELNDDFPEDFFEVLHILLGQKIKILENRPDFLTFSAKTHIRL